MVWFRFYSITSWEIPRALRIPTDSVHVNKGIPGGSVVKNPPAMPETRVRSLGREDPLEEEMATLSSTLSWRIPWTEEPGGLPSPWSRKSQI